MSLRSALPGSFQIGHSPPLRCHPAIPHISRRSITIPHPDLSPEKGTTRLAVRTLSRIPSMIHAFAIVRAIESKFGTVISIELPKDYDTLLPQSIILLTLLRPVQLPLPLLLEISPPNISRSSNHLGGPSLDDVRAALRFNQTAHEQGTISETPLQFKVEELSRRSYVRPKKRVWRNPRRTGSEVAEDEEIVEALQKFGGGFFGGFEGLADKFKHLARREEGSEEERERAAWTPSARIEQMESDEPGTQPPKTPVESTSSPASTRSDFSPSTPGSGVAVVPDPEELAELPESEVDSYRPAQRSEGRIAEAERQKAELDRQRVESKRQNSEFARQKRERLRRSAIERAKQDLLRQREPARSPSNPFTKGTVFEDGGEETKSGDETQSGDGVTKNDDETKSDEVDGLREGADALEPEDTNEEKKRRATGGLLERLFRRR